MKIVLEHLTKKFPGRGKKNPGDVTAVNDFTCEIPDGELGGLLGPSGCGKSTTLNMICGLETPTDGKILFGDEDVTKLSPELRGVGMVFQNRDGYISYLLAQKYGAPADICEMVSEQPLRKIVTGRHVEFSHGKWRKKSEKRYVWIYPLKAPIVPGDILLANTKSGGDLICADSIDYIAGQEFCAKYKKIRKHMHMRMEKGEYTDHEK